MSEEHAPPDPIACPLCRAPGRDPYWFAGRWRWHCDHDARCPVVTKFAAFGTEPRDEWDYLDGNPYPFEPADLIERGHTR